MGTLKTGDTAGALAARDQVGKLLNVARDGNLRTFKEAATELAGGQEEDIGSALADVKDGNNRGPLCFAARGGQTEICRYLVEELRLPVDPIDKDGETPLIHAARLGFVSTADYLLDQGADPHTTAQAVATSAIHHAAGTGSLELIKRLLDNGVSVDAASSSGTPLIWAVAQGRTEAVELLLERGADPNATTEDDVTALLAAAAAKFTEIVELLVKYGADVTTVASGVTALHVAAEQGDEIASDDWPFTNAWSLHGNKEIVSRYEILERIGQGTFGEVHRARRREDNLIVALKEIHDFDSSDREIKALLLLDHPNVVKLHEYFAQGSNMVLVLEYLPHDLSEVVRAGKGELSDAEVKGWMIQILQGLAACHAASVFHRDLKPNNLLISEDRILKIADFGQARILSEIHSENEEGLFGSEIEKNYGTGSEGQSVHDSPTMRDSQEGEFQADFSVAEGKSGGDASIKVGGVPSRTSKVEASVDYFGVRSGQSMGKGNSSMSGNDVDSIEEALDGRWERSSGEAIPHRDECKSWTQTEGYNSTLSDAEGTRWYGAPEFQYSYMDSKIASLAGGKVPDEKYGHATGSDEEWEKEGSDVGTCSGAHSHQSTRRDNRESEHGSDFTTMVGTRWYKAPELLYGATKYGMGIDIWAVGCIFGELLLGKPLFPGLNDIDQLSRLVRILGCPNEKIWAGVSLLPDFNKICFVDDRSPLTLRKYVPDISEAALEFLQKLLTYDPALRPTAEKAFEDGFFVNPPLPCPCHELQLPTGDESDASDEEWGNWKDPGSPFSDFEILG